MKATSLVQLALNPDAPAHQFDKLCRDCQAKTRAAIPARCGRICLNESAEDLPLLIRCDTYARIGNSELQRHIVADTLQRHIDNNFPALGELDRVTDEIDEHLPQSS